MRTSTCIISVAAIFLVTSCVNDEAEVIPMTVNTLDLNPFSADKPQQPIHLLFIHHSTGGQLFADKGPDIGRDCIYTSHPNGGGLRRLLTQNSYIVHEASYGSTVGDKTDICHWNAKFRDHMEKILTCKNQDEFFTDGTRNRVIMFKSCFPNSYIEAEGTPPGDPDSCQKTLANYQAVYNALRDYFAKRPDTLFVVVTAPPLVKPWLGKRGKIRVMIKTFLGRENTVAAIGSRNRQFNNWLKDVENGWLKDYPHKNIVVFDYYDVLTGHGKSNWSLYPSGDGKDDHPNADGNSMAAQEMMLFLNKAVHRIGL